MEVVILDKNGNNRNKNYRNGSDFMKKLSYLFVVLMLFISSGCVNSVTKNIPSKNEKIELTLYFHDKDGLFLHKEKRITERGRGKIELLILDELFDGPENEKELTNSVLGDVEILSVKTENGKCTLDLSEEFLKYNTGGSAKETFAIYSIVNSLCELENIDQVKINIEGNEKAEFGGHFVLEDAFLNNTDIVK